MKTNERRIYHGVGELLSDIRGIFSQRKSIRKLMRGNVITPAFRERLMLTVTGVNQCRYCSYAHSRQALSDGITKEEIDELTRGMFDGSPQKEIPALLFAQHWAESNGKPETAIRNKVENIYGSEVMTAIELTLRMIRVGNLSGNTFDFILSKATFGRLGV